MMDGVAIKRHSILAGIGGIAGIAAIWRRRKSHTLYIVLPKVHLGKRQKRISRKPVRAKRVFHPRTLGGVKVKGDGKARSTKALGGVASPLPDSPPYGQRGRCPSRVAKSCAKLTGRRFAALEPSGAAGWAVKVLHGTHGVRRGISVREAADRRWRSRADETLTGAPNERRNAVRDPKTPSRPSPCGAPRARVVPEP